MPIRQKIRWLIALGVLVLTLLLLFFIFFATQTVIGVWHELQTVPDWLFYTYMFVIGLATVTSLGIILRLVLPSFKKSKKEPPPDAESIENELAQAESDGVDIAHIRQELAKLQARKAAGQVYISLFGDVSTGKSSLIKALVPDAKIETHVRGGSTQTVTEYQWQLPNAEDSLCLIDLPGRNEAAGQWETMIEEEALRAQVVVYVTDTDLTRSQFDDIQALHGFNKPLIIAVNKCDRYQSDEQDQLRQRIVDVCTQMDKAAKQAESPDGILPAIPFINRSSWQVVFTSAGGMETITKIYPDGREEKVLRERKPKINALVMALQDKIDQQYDTLDQLRDASVFVLTQRKLDDARESFRKEQAEKIIQQSTRHAILGAMAAISP
ncbi:MAG TPA: GTP-binding protein, partial [Thiothrix sp.]|nr:GTP-binding protein [Thiothrix sp.]